MEVLSAAQRFQSLLRTRASEIEQARRLPEPLAREMAAAGFFRMLVPESLGGAQASPGEFSQILQTLAVGDASAAWCAMVAGTSALTLAYLAENIAGEMFNHPDVIMGGVFAPMGTAQVHPEHYLLNGRWQWGSGSQNCDWLAVGARLQNDDADAAATQRMLIFPRDQAELIDTWHVSGLKGTGSGDIKAEDIQVPLARSVSLADDKPVATGALYVFPVFGLLALGIASVALGNAEAALDAIRMLAQSKRPGGGRRTLAERGAAQAEFARAQALFGSAQAYLQQAVEKNWSRAQQTGSLEIAERAELRLACTHAVRSSAEVTRIACDLGGGAAVFLDNELQRRFRDAHVATAHMMVAPPTYELTGRLAFGLDTDVSQL